MRRTLLGALILAVATLPNLAAADDLTAIIQQDLTTLGYETGGTDGQMTVKTAVAVSKFQAENGLDVTGEITPQLAGVVKAAIRKQGQAAPVAKAAPPPAPAQAAAPAPAAVMPAGMDPAAMQAQAAQTQAAQAQAAQQACLQQKMAAAQEAQKKKRGLGSLMRAVSRIGGDKVASVVADVSADAYAVGATVADLESAAKDLGLTESDVEACRNPQ